MIHSQSGEAGGAMKFDIFISYASEDKQLAKRLAEALQQAGLRVWYDDFELKLGDSISESVDAGLAESRFGVVIISRHFLHKPWPKRELRGLVSRELASGGRVILPIWHGISKNDLMEVSPPLADVLAVSTDKGVDHVATRILNVVGPEKARPIAPHGTATKILAWEVGSAAGGPPVDGLDGEYIVAGRHPDGSPYRGRATVKEYENVVIIASAIGASTFICQGRRELDVLKVYGDFEVEYRVQMDGTLEGTWGNGGVESLTPIKVLP
jgi:TIR domain-containing protein